MQSFLRRALSFFRRGLRTEGCTRPAGHDLVLPSRPPCGDKKCPASARRQPPLREPAAKTDQATVASAVSVFEDDINNGHSPRHTWFPGCGCCLRCVQNPKNNISGKFCAQPERKQNQQTGVGAGWCPSRPREHGGWGVPRGRVGSSRPHHT